MSGLYLSGMEMPTRCLACQLAYDSCSCILTGEGFYKHGEDFDPGEKRLDNCPLLPVPDHGRLIDADADPSEYVTVWDCECSEFGRQTVMAVDDLMYLPTIIPADHFADVGNMADKETSDGS